MKYGCCSCHIKLSLLYTRSSLYVQIIHLQSKLGNACSHSAQNIWLTYIQLRSCLVCMAEKHSSFSEGTTKIESNWKKCWKEQHVQRLFKNDLSCTRAIWKVTSIYFWQLM
jgi:hypothetical protein